MKSRRQFLDWMCDVRQRLDEGSGALPGEETEVVPLPPEMRVAKVPAATPLDVAARYVLEAVADDEELSGSVEDGEIIDNQVVLYFNETASNRFDDLIRILRERCSMVELLAKPGDEIDESKGSNLFIFLVRPNLTPTSAPAEKRRKKQ